MILYRKQAREYPEATLHNASYIPQLVYSVYTIAIA